MQMGLKILLASVLLSGLVSCAAVGTSKKESEQASIHYKLGVSHLQANNPTLALKELLLAVEYDPRDAAYHDALARAYQRKKAYPQAEQHYLKALQLENDVPRYQNNLASLYLDMEEWDKAIEYFDKAASNLLFGSAHVALTGKGLAYFNKEDYRAAQRQFAEAIAINPRYMRAYYYQSETYREMGETALARESLEKAISYSPGFVPALYQLGVMDVRDGLNATARTRFERVVELAPTSDWGLKAAQLLRALQDGSTDPK